MRRKDREITELSKIYEILNQAEYGHLALCDGNRPYGITLNYGYEIKNNVLFLYFHAAHEGRKIDCIRRNNNAYFHIETGCRFYEGEKNGEKYWTMFYSSVAAEGTIDILETPEEKFHALQVLMNHFIGDTPFDVSPSLLRNTALLRMKVDSITGKQNPNSCNQA